VDEDQRQRGAGGCDEDSHCFWRFVGMTKAKE